MRKEVVQLRCSEIEKQRWIDAANSVGLELSPWIRLTLDRSLRTPQPTALPTPIQFDDPNETTL